MLANVFTKTTLDRWKGMVIAVVSLVLMLLLAMAVYRQIDVGVYDELPEAFRTLMNIPEGADAAGLAVGVLYGLYGALTLAGIALSMGSASIAGEERDHTLGLLLGNPRSRTRVLASKAASIVLLVALGTAALWGAAYLVAGMLDVSLTGMHIGAYSLHLGVNALFYGSMAMAIGAWTGRRGLASGVTVAVMAISYIAVGLLPVIEGWENAVKAFPWYYFDGSRPITNGVSWGHLGVLLGGIAACAAIAWYGVNRRDLRDSSEGTSLVDRLRADPRTQKIVERLAGSARVSRIWIKTATEHQGVFIVTAYAMFLVMGVMMGPLYSLLDQTLREFADQIPEALYAFVGAGGAASMSTPEGFYEVETFGLMAWIAVMVVTVAIGGRGLAGEEAHRTMGLLLANPVSRTRVLLEKAGAMAALGLAVGVVTFAGVWIGSLLGGLGISVVNIAVTSFMAVLIGLVFGALALAIAAGTGLTRVAVFGSIGAALVFHIVNSFATLSDSFAGLAKVSPFYYYLSNGPLTNGIDWGHVVILTAIAAALVAMSVVLFNRRDLRQSA
jgi:ABC-2 type transport system permease protein